MSDPTLAAPGPAAAQGVRFTARDLVNVAIFAVIYFVLVYLIAMIGIVGPLVMLITLPLASIAGGVPYLLFLTRVKHAGMVTLYGVVIGLLFLISGQPWIATVLTVVVSVLADVIMRTGLYRSRWAAIWAYTTFNIWMIGPWIPLLVNREEYLNAPGMQVMGPEYVASFDQVVSVPALILLAVVTVICGVLGGLLGSRLLRKHFVRAGAGDELRLPGIITLDVVDRPARSGRNPQTGEPLEVPAGKSVRLRAGSRLKAAARPGTRR